MGVLSRLLSPKAETLRDRDGWLYEALSGGKTSSGIMINESNALNLSAVYACVRIISETIGSLSLNVYEEKGREKRKAIDHPLYSILHDSPNPEMTSMVFRETLQANLLTWGNAYAEIQRNGNTRPVFLWPLHSGSVTPERIGNNIVYRVRESNGESRLIESRNILHIPGLGFDGLMGMSPIRLARESLGLSSAAEGFGASFFGNGAHVGGVLEHPGKLNTDTIKLLRKSWEEIHQGSKNSHKVAILEEGMKWAQTTIPPNDAQFLETRKFQTEEIARWFNVPPHKIKHLERSTFNNIEHQSIEFVQDTIRPWLVRWEQEIKRKLFLRNESNFYAEHKIDSLLRGDAKARSESYMTGVTGGWLSRNEVREMENLNPVNGLDEYLVPLNMGNSSDEPEETETPEINEREQKMTESVADRLARKEISQAEKSAIKEMSPEKFAAWARDFYDKHSEVISESLAISKERAERYAHNTCEALISYNNNADITGFNLWREGRFSALRALPYEEVKESQIVHVNVIQAAQEAPVVHVDATQDAPIVNLGDTHVNFEPYNIEIKNETPIVNVTNEVNVPEPLVTVNVENQVETPIVNIENKVEAPEGDRQVNFQRDSDGNIIGANIHE